jgi:hypothetical protein
MTLLLVVLVVFVFLIPVAVSEGLAVRLANDAFMVAVLGVGSFAVARHGRAVLLLLGLTAVLVALRGSAWFAPGAIPLIVSEGASLALMLLLAVLVADHVFTAGRVTADRVVGAVVLYLMLAICWALAYNMIATVSPHAFSAATQPDEGVQRWIYYSFVTLTTVGFGDITPLSRGARSLTVLEALVGQLYPAVILARLVTLQTDADAGPDPR